MSDNVICDHCGSQCPDPLSLRCGHTVCDTTCLRRDEVYQFDVFCPVCGSSFDYIEAVLPLSYAKEEDLYQRDPDCSGCGQSSKSFSECLHCGKKLCYKCVKSHLDMYSPELLSKFMDLKERFTSMRVEDEKFGSEYNERLLRCIQNTIESSLIRAETSLDSLEALLTENGCRSTNAGKSTVLSTLSEPKFTRVSELCNSMDSVRTIEVSGILTNFRDLVQDAMRLPNTPPVSSANNGLTERQQIHSGGSMASLLYSAPPSLPCDSSFVSLDRAQIRSPSLTVSFSSRAETAFENSAPAKPQPVAKCASIYFQGRTKGGVVFPRQESLERHFRQFGVVMKLTVSPVMPTGNVTFQRVEEAQKALCCTEHVVDGCSLVLISRKDKPTANGTSPVTGGSASALPEFQPSHSVGSLASLPCSTSPLSLTCTSPLVSLDPALTPSPSLVMSCRFRTSEKGAVKSRSANPVQLTLRPVSQRSVKKLPNDTIKEYFKQFGKFVRVKQNKEEVNVTLILRKGEEVAQKVFTVPEHVVNGVRLEVVGHLELPPLVVDPEEVRKFVKFKIETSKPLEQLPTDKVIRKHFKEFGVVTLCKRFPSSPHGQVRFKTAEQAELAVSASEHVVDGFVFKVGLCGRKGRSK